MFSDFKKFAIQGNMLDLAIGIIIGGAFGKIINSIVADLIMPPFGYLLKGVDFKDMKYSLQPEIKDAAGKVTQAAINVGYGAFIQVCIEFVIIAFSIFMVVKLIERMKRNDAAEVAAAPPPAPSAEIVLLTEIRDALKK